MEIAGLNMKEAELFLSGLVTEIRAGSEVHIDLSEEMSEVIHRGFDTVYNAPTGKMTLVVKWKRDRDEKRPVINKERISEIALEVEEEMGYSGLTNAPHGEFALRVAERYIEEVEG